MRNRLVEYVRARFEDPAPGLFVLACVFGLPGALVLSYFLYLAPTPTMNPIMHLGMVRNEEPLPQDLRDLIADRDPVDVDRVDTYCQNRMASPPRDTTLLCLVMTNYETGKDLRDRRRVSRMWVLRFKTPAETHWYARENSFDFSVVPSTMKQLILAVERNPA